MNHPSSGAVRVSFKRGDATIYPTSATGDPVLAVRGFNWLRLNHLTILMKPVTDHSTGLMWQRKYGEKCRLTINGDTSFTVTFAPNGDLNEDGKRGIEEVIMLLQEKTGN